jgi:ABC-type molybdenum transport system ATPase subunit/photorepair protein PhrA
MLSKKNRPLVIHGQSGSGKTSLMAMIAKNSFDWFDGKATVVLRYEIFMFLSQFQANQSLSLLVNACSSRSNKYQFVLI